jgi:hypothetical protein
MAVAVFVLGEFTSRKGIELGEGHIHGVEPRWWDQTHNFSKCWINILCTCPLTETSPFASAFPFTSKRTQVSYYI